MRARLLSFILGKAKRDSIKDLSLQVYADIWPKHKDYEVKNKIIIFKALTRAYMIGKLRGSFRK